MNNPDEIDDKENSEFHYNEHLRFSLSSYSRSSHQSDDNMSKRYSRSSLQSDDDMNKRISGGSSYNHNKRLSRTKGWQKPSSKQHRSSTSTKTTIASSESSNENTIAIFGAYGVTGQYFLKFALEAGYSVRALTFPGLELDDMVGNDKLTSVEGTFDEEQKLERVVRKAAYVVCMINDCESHSNDNFSFIQKLVPIMERCRACRVLLYQASSYALDDKGSTPMFSQLVKKMTVRKSKRDLLNEQDQIVQYICTALQSSPDGPSLQFIVTRPSDLVWDRPSRKKLAASKSQPGPFPITNIDLAEFSLNALKMEKLYNTCPYVVQDGL